MMKNRVEMTCVHILDETVTTCMDLNVSTRNLNVLLKYFIKPLPLCTKTVFCNVRIYC